MNVDLEKLGRHGEKLELHHSIADAWTDIFQNCRCLVTFMKVMDTPTHTYTHTHTQTHAGTHV